MSQCSAESHRKEIIMAIQQRDSFTTAGNWKALYQEMKRSFRLKTGKQSYLNESYNVPLQKRTMMYDVCLQHTNFTPPPHKKGPLKKKNLSAVFPESPYLSGKTEERPFPTCERSTQVFVTAVFPSALWS